MAVMEEATDGFFVEEQDRGDENPPELPDRIDLELLAIGKRVGLTFEEINRFRVCDLISYVDIIMKEKGKETAQPRRATQEDIDAFYARNF